MVPQVIAEQFTDKTTEKTSKSILFNDSILYFDFPLFLDIHNFMKKSRFEDLIQQLNVSTVESRFNSEATTDGRVCHIYHYEGFCVRVNTLANLWQINRKV